MHIRNGLQQLIRSARQGSACLKGNRTSGTRRYIACSRKAKKPKPVEKRKSSSQAIDKNQPACEDFVQHSTMAQPRGLVRLAVIGDVHGHWYEEDAQALQSLDVDAAVFIGDFGEESLGLIRLVARAPIPKAVILGNHDAWYSLTDWALNRWLLSGRDAGDDAYSGVQRQLDALGSDHVGYVAKQFQGAKGAHFSIVGGRPFSKGGASWTSVAKFYNILYQVDSFETSAQVVADTILSQPEGCAVVVAAHNGPTGLGTAHHSICGADFKQHGGDHGDPDLESALKQAEACGRHVALVLFGHMHEGLKFGRKLRNMVEVDPITGAVYLNCAVVPRVRNVKPKGTDGSSAKENIVARHFVIAEISDGMVSSASNVWVGQRGGPDSAFEVLALQGLLEIEEGNLTESQQASGWVKRRIWRGFEGTWETVTTQRQLSEAHPEMQAA